VDDIVQGLVKNSIWRMMAWQDILVRYRGSALGPFWLTISMGIMIAALGIIYSRIFKADVTEYIPFLCLGLMTWTLISAIVLDACGCFISAETIIKQIKMPFSVHVFRVVWRNLIIAGHNIVVYIGVMVYFQIMPTINVLYFVPALILTILNAVWVCLILGMMCARFRDIPQIVSNVVQIIFFVTPIIWYPRLLGADEHLVHLNPFFAFIDLLRSPLLNNAPAALSWGVALGTTVAGWAAALFLFSRFRARISYWV